jgi:hypothetical protein
VFSVMYFLITLIAPNQTRVKVEAYTMLCERVRGEGGRVREEREEMGDGRWVRGEGRGEMGGEGRWEMGEGRGEMGGDGRWEMGDGGWEMGDGGMGDGRWTYCF